MGKNCLANPGNQTSASIWSAIFIYDWWSHASNTYFLASWSQPERMVSTCSLAEDNTLASLNETPPISLQCEWPAKYKSNLCQNCLKQLIWFLTVYHDDRSVSAQVCVPTKCMPWIKTALGVHHPGNIRVKTSVFQVGATNASLSYGLIKPAIYEFIGNAIFAIEFYCFP